MGVRVRVGLRTRVTIVTVTQVGAQVTKNQLLQSLQCVVPNMLSYSFFDHLLIYCRRWYLTKFFDQMRTFLCRRPVGHWRSWRLWDRRCSFHVLFDLLRKLYYIFWLINCAIMSFSFLNFCSTYLLMFLYHLCSGTWDSSWVCSRHGCGSVYCDSSWSAPCRDPSQDRCYILQVCRHPSCT